MNNIIEKIHQQIQTHPVLLYMKGTPNNFKCGFSSKAAKILSFYIQSFAYIDVTVHTDIRNTLPIISNWPTFPQLWIEEKLIGGYDILADMHHSGSLEKLLTPIKIKYNLK